ncbi:MAG TPA: SGNH/GDSL hydrolase family protein [Microbacterium sp.]|nr:SGNH/GDSL hydrolase family protein [Microbacterium sp.]
MTAEPQPVTPRAIVWWMLRAAMLAVGTVLGLFTAVLAVTTAQGLLVRGRLWRTRLGEIVPFSGSFGADNGGGSISLGVMGDSLSVGYGAESSDGTPGVILAKGLAEASGSPVTLTNVGQVGAESFALLAQLAQLREQTTPDVVVIIVGANDVMRLRRLADALWPLSSVVRELRKDGVQVVVATCPDLGTVQSFRQPLRFFAHWYSRVLATSQVIVTLRAGGRSVSLGDTLGPLFRADPVGMFSAHDHLHPSNRGYEAAASVILPSVRVAAGTPLSEDAAVRHRVYRKGSRHTLAWWAFRASRRAGERLTGQESAVQAAVPVTERADRRTSLDR